MEEEEGEYEGERHDHMTLWLHGLSGPTYDFIYPPLLLHTTLDAR
jgi:hypothetical protein